MTTEGPTNMLLDPALNQNVQSNVILSFLISFQFLFLQNFPLQSCHSYIISIILLSFHFHLFLLLPFSWFLLSFSTAFIYQI